MAEKMKMIAKVNAGNTLSATLTNKRVKCPVEKFFFYLARLINEG